MASPLPVAEILADLRQALDTIGARWYLFGAQAAILHGVARLTADVDVTVALGDRPIGELVVALAGFGIDRRAAATEEFVDATRVLPLVHVRSRMPVDVVLAGPGLEELFLLRAEEREVQGVRVPVACAEDLIAMKVLAGRPKDLEDAASIVRARGREIRVAIIRETLEVLERALDRRDLMAELNRLLGQTW